MNDKEQLDLLGTFHYVLGGLALLMGFFPIIHLVVGILIMAGSFPDQDGKAPPAAFGLIFACAGIFVMALCWIGGAAQILAGKRLKQRQRYKFCFVVACIECVLFPFGTVLGVFTLIVLNRPTVQTMFGLSPESEQVNA